MTMTMTASSPAQADPAAPLIIGAEVWSPVEAAMVRQAATPSIGDIEDRLGTGQSGRVSALVDRAKLQKLPMLLALDDLQVTAWAWPVIDRDQVTSVVVMYCSTAGEVRAAIELWTGRAGRSELCLASANYTGLDRFAKLSPHISFPKGSGLPGLTWETNIPQVLEGLGTSPRFMRASGAEAEGLGIGFALPCISGSSLQAVALLLSGKARPIARVYETWLPRQRAGSLRLARTDGAYVSAPALKKASRQLDVPAGDTWIGRAWATRKPEVVCDSTGTSLKRAGAAEDGITSGIAIPIIVLDDVSAVAVLMW